jgi:hypothetical protein
MHCRLYLASRYSSVLHCSMQYTPALPSSFLSMTAPHRTVLNWNAPVYSSNTCFTAVCVPDAPTAHAPAVALATSTAAREPRGISPPSLTPSSAAHAVADGSDPAPTPTDPAVRAEVHKSRHRRMKHVKSSTRSRKRRSEGPARSASFLATSLSSAIFTVHLLPLHRQYWTVFWLDIPS